jgi:hypothetical protein
MEQMLDLVVGAFGQLGNDEVGCIIQRRKHIIGVNLSPVNRAGFVGATC